MLLEIGYVCYASGDRPVLTPHDPSLPPVFEEIDHIDREIFFNLGALFAF